MSVTEVEIWRLFRRKNGPLNPMLRIDSAVARAGALFLKDRDPKHLMPYPRDEDEEAVATLDDFMSILRAAKKPEKK
jgi:hypothetical protein